MKRVSQRRKWECGIACAAMLTGARYHLLRNRCGPHRQWWKFKKKDRGLATPYFIHLVARHSPITHYTIYGPDEPYRLQRGFVAEITLPSIASQKRRKPAWHAIVWDGQRILDPSARRRYRSRWQVERRPRWVTEFRRG